MASIPLHRLASIFLNDLHQRLVELYSCTPASQPAADIPHCYLLLTTFRLFVGSFGSAIGGGIFPRILRASLEQGFVGRGMTGRGELVTELLGSLASVSRLEGAEKDVATTGWLFG